MWTMAPMRAVANPCPWTRWGRFWWRCAFVLCALVVCALSLAPPTALPPSAFSVWDKAQHALAFVALAVLGLQAYPGRWGRLWLGLLLLGAAIELAQAAVGWRQGDVADWVADAVGVALGTGLFRALRRLGVLWPATT